MNAPETFTLNLSRFNRAPREKVFDAFATQAGLAAWTGPRGMREMAGQLAALDKAYGSVDFLAGARLSGADLFVAPILAYLQLMPEGGQLMAHYPNVLGAQNLLRQRVSFTSTHPQ